MKKSDYATFELANGQSVTVRKDAIVAVMDREWDEVVKGKVVEFYGSSIHVAGAQCSFAAKMTRKEVLRSLRENEQKSPSERAAEVSKRHRHPHPYLGDSPTGPDF